MKDLHYAKNIELEMSIHIANDSIIDLATNDQDNLLEDLNQETLTVEELVEDTTQLLEDSAAHMNMTEPYGGKSPHEDQLDALDFETNCFVFELFDLDKKGTKRGPLRLPKLWNTLHSLTLLAL